MDVQFQLFGFAKHRKAGYGNKLASGVGDLFPGIHLSRDKEGEAFGKFRVEGLSEIIGLLVCYAFKIELCRPFGPRNQVLVQSAPSSTP